MHYKDGTLAQLGDIVRGRGYNIKHDIIGPVVHLVRNQDTCNIQIALVEIQPLGYSTWQQIINFYDGSVLKHIGLGISIEYGAVKDFELVYRRQPDAKPAEKAPA